MAKVGKAPKTCCHELLFHFLLALLCCGIFQGIVPGCAASALTEIPRRNRSGLTEEEFYQEHVARLCPKNAIGSPAPHRGVVPHTPFSPFSLMFRLSSKGVGR